MVRKKVYVVVYDEEGFREILGVFRSATAARSYIRGEVKRGFDKDSFEIIETDLM